MEPSKSGNEKENVVFPAKAGNQKNQELIDSRFRGNDIFKLLFSHTLEPWEGNHPSLGQIAGGTLWKRNREAKGRWSFLI